MKPVKYFTTNIDEDDEDTDLLPAAERGLYHTLQKVYLRHRGPLPADWQWLYLKALARTDADKRAMRALMPKRFKPVLIEGKAHWLNERGERELARIGKKMGTPASHGAMDGGLHGALHPQTISLNNQRNDLPSEEVKSEGVNESLCLPEADSSNDCRKTIVEEVSDSIEIVPAAPKDIERVAADTATSSTSPPKVDTDTATPRSPAPPPSYSPVAQALRDQLVPVERWGYTKHPDGLKFMRRFMLPLSQPLPEDYVEERSVK